MHLAEHFRRWLRLAPCFTHERFHKLAKSYASTRRNTTSYERGIIEYIAASQSCSNEEATFGYMGLVNPVAPTATVLLRFRASPLIAKDAVIAVARVYTTGLFRIAKGDVVFGKPHLLLRLAQPTFVFPWTARARPLCRHSPRAPETAGSCTVQSAQGEYVIIDSSDQIRSAIYARTANPCSCLGSVRPTRRAVAD